MLSPSSFLTTCCKSSFLSTDPDSSGLIAANIPSSLSSATGYVQRLVILVTSIIMNDTPGI